MYHKVKTRASKKKKKFLGGYPAETQIGETIRKNKKARGGSVKAKLLKVKIANVLADGKHIQCEVLRVKENPASRDLTRRNIITKGAVIEVKTTDGKEITAKVTSRPGQDGVVNAVKA